MKHGIYERLQETAHRIARTQPHPAFYLRHAEIIRRVDGMLGTDGLIRRCRASLDESQLECAHGLCHCETVARDAGALVLIEAPVAGIGPRFAERLAITAALAGLLHDIKRKEQDHALRGRSEYLGRVDALKKQCPGLALTADCIVGFPGETDEDFERTMDLMEKVRFDGIFSFIYSARKFTAAAKLAGGVPSGIAHERLSRFQVRQIEITLESNKNLEGKKVEVLVEGRSKNSPDELIGRTRTGKIVNFTGDPGAVYKLVEVDIIKGYANSLRGKILCAPGR